MSDKNLLQLPLATTGAGALIYGIQDNQDKAFPASVLQGSEQPQAANLVYAGPPAPPGNFPTFRPLVVNDIPDLSTIYLKSNGGTLVNPTINNASIVGGNISGATITADDDKWSVRNALDTTKVIRFNVANVSAGNTRIYSWPDASGTVILENTHQIMANKILFLLASTSASASFRIPHGQPPASPINGDMWTTNAGVYVQINNATVGPLAAAASSTVTTFNGRQGAVTLTFADVTNALGYTPYNPATGLYVNKTGDIMSGTLSISGNGNNMRMYDNNKDVPCIEMGGGSYSGTDRNGWIINRNSVGSLALWGRAGDVQLTLGTAAKQSSLTGNLSVEGLASSLPINVFSGPISVQQALINIGWSNGVRRWAQVMESDASLALYSYNSSGGSPTRLVTIATDGSRFDSGSHLYAPSMAVEGAQSAFWIKDRTSANRWATYVDGNIWKLWNGASDIVTVNTGGNLHAVGAITSAGGYGPGSDPKLKDELSLKTVDKPVDILYNLNVRYGKYKDFYNSDGKERVFLMADDAMERHAPHILKKDVVDVEGTKYNGWDVDQTVALLVAAVQQLKDEIEHLKEKLNER